MRQTLLLAITVLAIQTVTAQMPAPYQIKSCKIDFVFSNGFQTGTKTIIFQDSGKIEKEEGVTYNYTSKLSLLPHEFNAVKPVSHILLIQTTDSVFQIDMVSSKGASRLRFGGGAYIPQDAKKIGQDTFLGKVCDIRDFHGFKMWYWKGLVLKKVFPASVADQMYEHATAIDENYAIKEDEFKVPAGIKMQ